MVYVPYHPFSGWLHPKWGSRWPGFPCLSAEKLDTGMSCGKLIVSQLTHWGLVFGSGDPIPWPIHLFWPRSSLITVWISASTSTRAHHTHSVHSPELGKTETRRSLKENYLTTCYGMAQDKFHKFRPSRCKQVEILCIYLVNTLGR